uniref:FTH domain-containing protein n=1 Tax=Panagrellus redivivus TaxID=6233 RepID=A0A7E4V1Q9_PANRE
MIDTFISGTNDFNFISEHFNVVKHITISPLRSENWVHDILECGSVNFQTLSIFGDPLKLISFTLESITTLFEKLPSPCRIKLKVNTTEFELAEQLLTNVFDGPPTGRFFGKKSLILYSTDEPMLGVYFIDGKWFVI